MKVQKRVNSITHTCLTVKTVVVGLTQNDALSERFLMIYTLLVTPPTGLELLGFELNHVHAIP